MSSRNVTKDEIIAIWLQREFERNWRYIEPTARNRIPQLTQEQIKSQTVDNPDYTNTTHNLLRFLFLSSFRSPLLRPVCNGNWVEKKLGESEFKELRVINRDPGWMYLSKPDGRLSMVAERVVTITSTLDLDQGLIGTLNAIADIKRSEIKEKLFLIGSED